MSTTTAQPPKASAAPSRRNVILLGAAAVVVVAMALDTTVVQMGSDQDTRQQVFSPDKFGEEHFPRIQAYVEEHAIDAPTLGAAVLADKAGAAKQYGTPSSTGAIMHVKLTAVAGEAKSGIYDLAIPNVPADIRVRIQTGPAINGTDLRDAPGDIEFGNFKNQIEYQDAGSGINRVMKKTVLDTIDAANLKGKTVDIVGAFRLINPKNWLITPVRVTVQ